jgi:hypothetical protein
MSQMLKSGEFSPQERAIFNQVIDINDASHNASYTDIPGFWINLMKTYEPAKLRDFNSTFLNHIANNPKEFLKVRTKTFLAANGLDSSYLGAIPTEFDYLSIQKVTNLVNSPGLQPSAPSLRSETSALIGMNFQNSVVQNLRWLLNGATLWIFLLIISSTNRRFISTRIPLVMLLFESIFIFVLSPASYSFYYVPIVLCGSFVFVFQLSQLKARNLSQYKS